MNDELKHEDLSYDNVARVCDGHERWHCDESCWIMALEAEVRRLRRELDRERLPRGDS